MTLQTKQIFEEVLSLPPVERAELIEKVFHSFDYSGRNNFDALWAKEAEARIDAFEQGKLKDVPARKVFQRIEKLK